MLKNSILKVFLNDKPEFPRSLKDIHSFSDSQDLIVDFDGIVLDDVEVDYCNFFGKDVSMRIFYCAGLKKLTCYSIPSEPVVTLHMQLLTSQYTQFLDGRDRSFWLDNQTRLCVQNDDIITFESEYGFFHHIDLFFRPSLIIAWADKHPVLRELAMEVATGQISNLDFLVGNLSSEVEEIKEMILEECDEGIVSNDRFLHLCECLLLGCMGVYIPIEPKPTERVILVDKESPVGLDMSINELFTEEELGCIAELKSFSEMDLITQYHEAEGEYFEKQVYGPKYYMDLSRMKALYFDIVGDVSDGLPDRILWMAKCFDILSSVFQLNEHEMKIVGKAICSFYHVSFQLGEPNPCEEYLYNKWSKRAYTNEMEVDEEIDDPYDLESFNAMQKNGRLGNEWFSYIPEPERNKPVEMVELYFRLKKHMTNSIMMKDQGTVAKSNLLFVLEDAYARNDFKLLLLLDILYSPADKWLIDRQSTEMICWWIVALKDGCKEIDKVNESIRKEEPLHCLMEIYESSPDKEMDVGLYAIEKKQMYEDLMSLCVKIKPGLPMIKVKSDLLKIAESFNEIIKNEK